MRPPRLEPPVRIELTTARLQILGSGGYDAFLFTSPDLPAGTYYEPDFEVAPFGDALDEFMILRLE